MLSELLEEKCRSTARYIFNAFHKHKSYMNSYIQCLKLCNLSHVRPAFFDFKVYKPQTPQGSGGGKINNIKIGKRLSIKPSALALSNEFPYSKTMQKHCLVYLV